MSFSFEDMMRNPTKRFWDEPKDVEIDPKVKLENESSDLIQIAKDRLHGRTTLGMSGDMGKFTTGDFHSQIIKYPLPPSGKFHGVSQSNFTEIEIRWITARATDIVNQKEGWNARDHWILACRMAEREVIMRRFKGND